MSPGPLASSAILDISEQALILSMPQKVEHMKIAVFSAFPQELTHVRKDSLSVRHNALFPLFLKKHCGVELLAVETGMGRANVEAAFTYIRNEYRPDIMLSTGFGGALYYRAGIGDLVFASRYLFLTREGIVELPQLSTANSRFHRTENKNNLFSDLRKRISISEGSFITIGSWVAKAKLKTLVPDGAPFPVCDRETIHLAKMACMSHIPFYAMRSITDTLDDEIPEEFFTVTDNTGNYRLSRALSLLISRPSLIPGSLKLGRNAARASKALGDVVHAFMEMVSAPAYSGHRKVFSEHPHC